MFVLSRQAMTRLLTAVVIAVLAVTTALMSGGAASAAPANNPVQYKIARDGDKVLLSVTGGSITRDGDLLSIRNNAGRAVWSAPLTYSLENKQFPIDLVKYSSNRVALVPIKDPARSTPADTNMVEVSRKYAQNYASDGYQTRKERDDAALSRFNSEVAAGMTITSIIFTVIGVILGVGLIGVIGCATIVACVPAITAGVAIGGIAGTIIGGSGSVVVAGIRYFNTISAPFTPPRKKKN
ncbi:MAG: glycine zipper family protein [Gordonia amarae]